MIGLMFYGVIGIWIIVAIYLGLKLPQWFKLNGAWAWLFVPLMIFAPVMDEVIALPQAYVLCKQAEEAFWYDTGAKGGVVKKGLNVLSREKLDVGLNISADRITYALTLRHSGKTAIKWSSIEFSSGFLHMPAGSSGTSIPLILPERCPSRSAQWPKIDAAEKELQLNVEVDPS
jgi:hypothetical protein